MEASKLLDVLIWLDKILWDDTPDVSYFLYKAKFMCEYLPKWLDLEATQLISNLIKNFNHGGLEWEDIRRVHGVLVNRIPYEIAISHAEAGSGGMLDLLFGFGTLVTEQVEGVDGGPPVYRHTWGSQQ